MSAMQQSTNALAGGFVAIENVLYEHSRELLLSPKELLTLIGIFYFQKHPRYRAVPSKSALAAQSRVSYSWTRRNLAALSAPQYDDAGALIRPAYLVQVIRRDGTLFYDPMPLRRACAAYLKADRAPEAAPAAKPAAPVSIDPLQRRLAKLFAGWCERDRNPARSLERVRLAQAIAGWTDDDLHEALAFVAQRTTDARPARHITHFLKSLDNYAAEYQLRAIRAAEAEAEERELERRSRQVEQRRQRIATPAPAPAAIVATPPPAAVELEPEQEPEPAWPSMSHRFLAAWGEEQNWPAVERLAGAGEQNWMQRLLELSADAAKRWYKSLVFGEYRRESPALGGA